MAKEMDVGTKAIVLVLFFVFDKLLMGSWKVQRRVTKNASSDRFFCMVSV